MKFLCENCGKWVHQPLVIRDHHGMPGPWYEEYRGCPYCGVAGMLEEYEDEAD